MEQPKTFRCPFEVKGIRDKTIIEVRLGDDKSQRLAAMCGALRQMYTDRSRTAVRFTLPPSLLSECDSNESLRLKILPYQSEFVAADIHTRLAPFLPYQRKWRQRFLMYVFGIRNEERWAANALARQWYRLQSPPQNVCQLSVWIEQTFRRFIDQGNPQLTYGSLKRKGKSFWLFMMDPSVFATYKDQDKLHDPTVNNVLLSIVKTPFYPKAFGRYSEQIEIVVTRDVDVARLPTSIRMQLRREANEVHAEHGVHLSDIEQQPTGLWIC